MPTPATSPITAFSRDVLGRYVCNGFDEALLSADPNPRPDLGRPEAQPAARPFDLVIIGGGTFGAALAEHLWFRGTGRAHRILMLEGGPFVLPEHVQNLPVLHLGVPGPTTIAQLRTDNQFGLDKPRAEVWGLPWQSALPFPGLAYCLGGRSLYWGGWSPELLDAELPVARWPAAVVNELRAATLADGSRGYFHQASDQIGVTQTNDFIFGELHRALRAQLFGAIGTVGGALAPAALPDHPAVRYAAQPPELAELAALLDFPAPPPGRSAQDLRNELKLEAPLAVQGQAGHAGFFPFNKFSAVPLLIKAAREAATESGGVDVNKRLMVVPHCHVNRLVPVADGAGGWRVGAVETNLGPLTLPADGRVIVALGTIESTRLVLASFANALPPAALAPVGANLLAHLRSNLDVRIPRTALASLPATAQALQASALFVKGRHVDPVTGAEGFFHLQITASGLGPVGSNSEAELFKKIPDVDLFDAHLHANDSHVVLTVRAIGEMDPDNPANRVSLDLNPNEQEFGVPRAFVSLAASARDRRLWEAMDRASDDVVRAVANGQPVDLIVKGQVRATGIDPATLASVLPSTRADGSNNPDRRDGLGTTHHEAGTLRMGDDPATSVTDANARLHAVANVYVAGPALFPTIGSPNPMLTGIALVRRLGDHLLPPAPAAVAEPGFAYLFDGSAAQHVLWRHVGGGGFRRVGRALIAQPGGELGLLYYTAGAFENFILRLDFLSAHPHGPGNDNSGVFLRFRDPAKPVPDPANPGTSHPYLNQAWVAVHTGFEIQIDDEARGQPADGLFQHRTGAVYGIDQAGTGPGQQAYTQPPPLTPEHWHRLEIEVSGQVYTVRLDGSQTTRFERAPGDAFRGQPPSMDPDSGFLGLQSHTGTVAFANVRLKTL